MFKVQEVERLRTFSVGMHSMGWAQIQGFWEPVYKRLGHWVKCKSPVTGGYKEHMQQLELFTVLYFSFGIHMSFSKAPLTVNNSYSCVAWELKKAILTPGIKLFNGSKFKKQLLSCLLLKYYLYPGTDSVYFFQNAAVETIIDSYCHQRKDQHIWKCIIHHIFNNSFKKILPQDHQLNHCAIETLFTSTALLFFQNVVMSILF